jgi:hypothetical protein
MLIYIVEQFLKFLNRYFLVPIFENFYFHYPSHTFLDAYHARYNVNRNLVALLSYFEYLCDFSNPTAPSFSSKPPKAISLDHRESGQQLK